MSHEDYWASQLETEKAGEAQNKRMDLNRLCSCKWWGLRGDSNQWL